MKKPVKCPKIIYFRNDLRTKAMNTTNEYETYAREANTSKLRVLYTLVSEIGPTTGVST